MVGQVGTGVGGPVTGVVVGRHVPVRAGHAATAERRSRVGRRLGCIGQFHIARHQQRPQDQRRAQHRQHAGDHDIAEPGQRLHAPPRHAPERQQHQAEHRDPGQTRDQAPAIQAHFPQRPHDGGRQRSAKQPQASAFAQCQQHTGHQHGDTGQHVIPGAANGHQAPAFIGERRTKHGEHHGIGHQQPSAEPAFRGLISHFELSGSTRAPNKRCRSWRERGSGLAKAAAPGYERAAPPRVLGANHVNILDPSLSRVRDGIGTIGPTCTPEAHEVGKN